MIAAALAVALAALPAAGQRYRVEIAGVPVGWAELAVACDARGCDVRWESALAAPEPGDAVLRRRVEARTSPDGRAERVQAMVDEGQGTRETAAGAGPAPASVAELLLSAAAEGERRCARVREEASGVAGDACATRRGEWLEGEVLGVALRFRAARGAAAQEVIVPSQRARFVADPAAALPDSPPLLFGSEVPAAPGARRGPLRFCGRAAEPERRGTPAAGVPRHFPQGASCREKTARYVALAAREGIPGRHVVGVAWDGASFQWHEWAELFTSGEWLPVDPSFRQVPAEGPRFAVARYAPGDAAARADAGRAVLACWGRAGVEGGR